MHATTPPVTGQITLPGPRVGVFPSMHDVNGEPGEAVPGRLRLGRRQSGGDCGGGAAEHERHVRTTHDAFVGQ